MNRIFLSKKSNMGLGVIVFLLFIPANISLAQDTIKVMSYNLLNYPGDTALNRESSFRTVIGYAQPDVLVVQEMSGGQAGVDTFYNKVVTQVLSGFSKGTFINGYDTDNAIFFRSSKFSFISNTVYATALRDINEFKLVHSASGDTFRVFSVHLKSSNGSNDELLRAAEVDSLRKATNNLGGGKSFIVVGDFNIYHSNESAYSKLISDGSNANGKFIDPISMPFPSNWNNSANASYHTQSPRLRQFGGGAYGGLDDRFDMILYSTALGSAGGTDYVPGSMTTVGNDGNHYNDSINQMPNTAVSLEVANALHNASDHLPVSAKFVFAGSVATTPTAQPTNLQFSGVSNSAMTVSWTAASPPANGYIFIRKQGSAPTGTPSQGTEYSAGNIIGDGVVAYRGSGTSFLDSGLSQNTTYHYAGFSFNGSGTATNYLATNPLRGSQTTGNSIPGYTWIGTTKDFQTASNWNPSRGTPATTDTLYFNRGGIDTINNLPAQTIAQIHVSNNSAVYFSASAARTLTLGGASGPDLTIANGSSLNFTGTAACTLSLSAGANAIIGGAMSFSGATGHRFFSADTASVVFQSGAVFTQTSGATGNAFGATSLRSIIFSSGASFISSSGANPFGAAAPNTVTVFQPGSWFKWNRTTGDLPAFSNRSYANFEFSNCSATLKSSGSACSMDTLKISSGTPAINFYPGFNIRYSLIIDSGATANFGVDSSTTLTFNGTNSSWITGTGTLNFGAKGKLAVNNAAGVSLGKDILLKDTLSLTNGLLKLNSYNLTLDSNSVISGTPSVSKMIVADSTGSLKKIFKANTFFTFPIGGGGQNPKYTPVSFTLTGNGGLSGATAAINIQAQKHPENLSPADFLSRYWTLSLSGFTNPVFNMSFTYHADDINGTEAGLKGGRWNGTKWILGTAADTSQNTISFSALTQGGDFTASAGDYVGGAAIVSIKAAPEGFYNTATNNLNLSDTIRYYAHNVISPYNSVDSAVTRVDSLTMQGRAVFKNLTGGSYYLVVKHRNSIETWSRPGGEALLKGANANYDFTSDSTKAYGQNLRKVNGLWFILGADVNQDGIVDFSDLSSVDNDSYNFTGGYVPTDVNGDGFVDFSDLSITDNNSYNFVSTLRPGAKK